MKEKVLMEKHRGLCARVTADVCSVWIGGRLKVVGDFNRLTSTQRNTAGRGSFFSSYLNRERALKGTGQPYK